MKILIVLFILLYAFIPKSFGHNDEIIRAEAFQACVNDCIEFEEPGYALKACLEQCKKRYLSVTPEFTPSYCNTDEEDCDRGDDSEI